MRKVLLSSTLLAAMAGPSMAANYEYHEYGSTAPHYATHQPGAIVGTPPQTYYVPRRLRHHEWNPIGAIMAVPRAALAVPGAILGGDDYYDGE